MRFRSAILLVSVVLPLTTGARAQTKVRIDVKSEWGHYKNSKWTISRKAFRITGDNGRYSAGGRPVDARLVESFLGVLREPLVATPTLETCGVDSTWLTKNLGIDADKSEGLMPLAQKQFEQSFDAIHLDDEPSIRTTITVGRETVVLDSASYYPFMIPWTTNGEKKNFNCHISLALAALLPDGLLNKSRLAGSTLKETLMDLPRHGSNSAE